MKNCRSIEKKLVAYLHGELNASDFQTVEMHLANCESCRAELESCRATLSLLGNALAAAPAPERVVLWNRRASDYPEPSVFSKVWNSAQLKGALVAGIFVCFMVFAASIMVPVKGGMGKPSRMCFMLPSPCNTKTIPLKKPAVKFKSDRVSANLRTATDVASGLVEYEMTALREIVEEKPKKPSESTRIVSKSEPASVNFQLPEVSGNGETGFGAGFDKGLSGGIEEGFAPTTELSDSGRLDEKKNAEKSLLTADLVAAAAPAPVVAQKANEPIAKLEVAASTPEDSSLRREREGYSQRRGDCYKKFEEKDADREVKRQALKPAVFNPYVMAEENAFSTFSIDVDTASYGLARQQLLANGLPEPELVRTEEFINSFDYDYRPPAGKQTFSVHSEMAPSPFRTGMDLLKVGIKGRRIGRDDHCGAVLTLVIDTSGSMSTPERLGLVKESLALLLDQLAPEDAVAIVQFGGEARLVCEHTPVSDKARLLGAIEALQPGGPTQFDQGLELGYQVAVSGFRAGDSNRIMILSDGVANLGELDPEAILEQVSEQRKKGIYLSVLGFGAGTYDDDLLEKLANRGDGMYAYIDTLDEARHLLVDQLASTLHVIASDVKIQIEFNPARVMRYRQLGYENRQLTKEQFRDDTVDAGEVGSGQSVTALYDVELRPDGPATEPIATVYVRYRRADNGTVEEISSRVTDSARSPRFEAADIRFRLAACTAEFAERLRRSPYADGTEMKDISSRLQPVANVLDIDAQVQELLKLIWIADRLER
ncbi:MAG: von Willebrand factor type A domain-containing protein [Pontiellaceae bacterium]|nr:von Willebrand factor type A domain-containing protein [Pontiellaceae bacterium]